MSGLVRRARLQRGALPALLLALGAGVLGSGGCGSVEQSIRAEPWEAMQDPRLKPESRARAVPVAWARARSEEASRTRALERFEQLYWGRAASRETRLAVIETLASDPDPEVIAWIRTTLRRALPVETDRAVVARIARLAGERGWSDFTGPLIRALARPVRGRPIERRSELEALRALHPDTPVERVAFETFLDPGEPEPALSGGDLDLGALTRRDAWNVLGRLDSDASRRRALIREAEREDHPQLAALKAGLADFGIVPYNGYELQWLLSLRDGEEQDRAWWSEAREAVDTLPEHKRGQLALRHLEPIRWAAAQRGSWLEASRDELRGELASRQAGRRPNVRSDARVQPDGGPNRERVSEWRDRLSWADLVALLVVDEAVRDQRVIGAIAEHAEADAADESTEYGGMLRARAGGGFEARLYPPRPSERFSDDRFVASEELLQASDTALAHYHLQVQEPTQRGKAGPSRGDLIAAARLGRTGVVFTSIKRGRLGVDAYQPDGVVIDLGEVELP